MARIFQYVAVWPLSVTGPGRSLATSRRPTTLHNQLCETVYGNATALATRELQILPSTHGDQSGVIGSAAMILDHVLSARAVDAAL